MSKKLNVSNFIGKKFESLTILSEALPKGKGTMVTVRCDCGKIKDLRLSHVKGGMKSCGCERVENSKFRNGLSRTYHYSVWYHMKHRCYNTSNPDYPNYGGRGIRVCVRWYDSLEAFISDMGERPSSKHLIDRIDNNGDYEPSNCRWATPKESSNNRRPYGTALPTVRA